MIERMIRAARLEPGLYEEVEHDLDATGQAALVVIIVAVASGIGNLRYGGLLGLILGIVSALAGWAIWSAIAYWVGKTLFATAETEVTLGQMLRTLGFAESAGVLYVFDFIPVLGVLIAIAVGIWILIAGVIAIRQAMDFSTERAVGTALVSFIPVIILSTVLVAIAANA